MQDSFSNFSTDQPSPISLREYGDVLRRRRAIILQTFVIVLVAGVLVTLFQPAVYHASGRLLLEAPTYTINQINSSDPLADIFRLNTAYSIPTQVELLQTDMIRKEVQSKVGNTNLPALTVTAVENTSIIQIDSEGDNPETVASAPNALMDIYSGQSLGANTNALDDALDFAKKHAASAAQNLATDENKLKQFKIAHNIQALQQNEQTQINTVNGLAGSLDALSAQISSLNARMVATQAAMDQTGQGKNAMMSYLEDPAIQSMENEMSAVKIQVATLHDLPGGYTDADPTIIRLRAQLSALQAREKELTAQFKLRNTHVNPEWVTLNSSLIQDRIQESDLQVRAGILQTQLKEAKARLAQFPSWQDEYEKLDAAAASDKSNLSLFSSKLFDLELRHETQTNHKMATVMEYASVPTAPIRPKKAQNIILGGLLGVFLGLCLALLQELFDDRINNPEEAERVLRVPTLGHIPMIEEEGLRLIRDISTFSPLMEAYRSLRTNINFAAVGSEMHSLVISSSVPAEGKSTTVANLAMAMALDNKQVIVVDADLRRPSLHKLFKKDASPGLTDLLVGTHTVDEVIQDTNVAGVRVISAGSPPPNPAELLGSSAMGHVLEVLEQSCDIVLFDSPPTLAVADGVVLASRTDGVILVVGYGETKKASTKKAIEILGRANANLLGTVLNRIEGPSSGYYYGKYYIPATDRVAAARAGASVNRSFNVPPPGSVDLPSVTGSSTVSPEDDGEESPRALPDTNQGEETR